MDSDYARAIPGVSVVICCYNSAERLPDTLQHLALQVIPPGLCWELLLIDNASTDDTAAIAGRLWQQYSSDRVLLRIVVEPRPGQMHARQTGVVSAKYETIVFCDDDNWLGKNYVAQAATMMQGDQRIGAGGGQIVPVTDAEKYPDWFDRYKANYATGIPGPVSGDLSARGFVLGAGMITRRSVFLSVFDARYPSLLNGRNGVQLSTGDDFEYCKRLLLREYTLFYDQSLSLTHFIPAERLTVAYRDRLVAGIEEATVILDQYDIAIRIFRRNKNKNRWRILFLSPFRSLMARTGLLNRVATDEAWTFYYLAPFDPWADPIKARIKKFYYHK